MSSTVGEVKIALKLDGSGLNAGAGKTLGSAFGNSWTVAAGNLISAGLQKLTSTVVSVGKSIIQTGMNYESAMSEVKAISGATADEMERLENKGIESASTSVFTCEQTAEAYKYMGMAGWNAGQMIEGLDGILNLAAASNLDLATTSDIVTDALTAFGYKAKDSGHFADVLAKTATNANTDVAMMGETFKYVGAVAGSMHYSIEDVGVAIGLMANSGIKASQAGTSLRGIISRLAKPTDAMLKVLDKLNVSLYDSTGKARPLNEVMVDLRKSFSGLTDAQKAEYATTLAGKNALTGMLAIVNASDADFKKLTRSINNADGAAEEMADTMLNNLAGAIRMVSSSWNSAVVELSRGNLDNFLKYLGQAVDGLSVIIEKGADTIADLMPKAMQIISSKMPEMGDKLGTAIGKLAPALVDGIAKMLPDLVKGAMSLATSLMSELGKQLPTLVPDVMNSLVDAIIAFCDNLPGITKAAIEFMTGFGKGLVKAVPEVVDRLPEIIDAIVNALIESAPEIAEASFTLMMELPNVFPKLVSQLPEKMGTLLSGILEHLGGWVGKIAEKAKEIGGGLVDGIKSKVSELPFGLGEHLTNAWHAITDFGGKVVAKASEIGSNFLNGLVDFFQHLPERVGNALSTVFTKTVEFGTNMENKALEIGSNVAKTLIEFFSQLPGKIWNFLTQTLSNFAKFASNIWNKAKEVAGNLFSTIVNKFGEIPGKMLEIGKQIVEGLWNGITGMTDWVADKVSGFANGVVDTVKNALGIHSPSKVMADQVGANIAKGVIEGVNKEMPKVKSNAVKLSNAYVSAAKSRVKEMEKANQITLTQEVGYWNKIISAVSKGTKAYKSAVSQLKTVKSKLKTEVKDLTADYIQDTAKVYKNLQSDIDKVNSQLAKEIESLEKEYTSAVNNRAKSIMNSVGLFSKVSFDKQLSSSTLIENLSGQVDALKQWDTTLNSLEKRIGNSALIDELKGMGVSSLKTLESINAMSEEELNTYISLYAQKSAIAQDRATRENAELKQTIDQQISALRTEAEQQIKELETAAKKEIDTLTKEYKKGLKELGVVASKSSKEVGKQIASGIDSALKEEMPKVQASLVSQVKAMVAAAKKALKIKSPSQVFRDEVGQMMAEGLKNGFVEGMDGATAEMTNAIPEPEFETRMTSLAQMALDMGEETEQMETENQPLIVNLEMDGQQIQQVILQDIRRSA